MYIFTVWWILSEPLGAFLSAIVKGVLPLDSTEDHGHLVDFQIFMPDLL